MKWPLLSECWFPCFLEDWEGLRREEEANLLHEELALGGAYIRCRSCRVCCSSSDDLQVYLEPREAKWIENGKPH